MSTLSYFKTHTMYNPHNNHPLSILKQILKETFNKIWIKYTRPTTLAQILCKYSDLLLVVHFNVQEIYTNVL